ncbi:hypothetical protein [Kaistia sp. MMO-174]
MRTIIEKIAAVHDSTAADRISIAALLSAFAFAIGLGIHAGLLR